MLRKIFSAVLLQFFFISICFSQHVTDSGTFLIHKFEQNIGKEKYTVIKNNTSINYLVDFKYVDRGSKVSLTSKLEFNSKTGSYLKQL